MPLSTRQQYNCHSAAVYKYSPLHRKERSNVSSKHTDPPQCPPFPKVMKYGRLLSPSSYSIHKKQWLLHVKIHYVACKERPNGKQTGLRIGWGPPCGVYSSYVMRWATLIINFNGNHHRNNNRQSWCTWIQNLGTIPNKFDEQKYSSLVPEPHPC